MHFHTLSIMLALASAGMALAADDEMPTSCLQCDDTTCPPHYRGGIKPVSPLPLLQDVDTPKGGKLKAFRKVYDDRSPNLLYWFRYTLPGMRNDLNASIIAIRYLQSVVNDTDAVPRKRMHKTKRSLWDAVAVDARAQQVENTKQDMTKEEPEKKVAAAAPDTTQPADPSDDDDVGKDLYTEFEYYFVQNGLQCNIESPIKNKGNDKVPLQFFAADIHYTEYNLITPP